MIIYLLLILNVFANSPELGYYKLNLEYPEGKVPFVLEILKVNKKYQAVIHNGQEKIKLTSVKIKNDIVKIPLQTYQNSLQLKFDKQKVSGYFIRHNKKPLIKFPVNGIKDETPLFPKNQSNQNLSGKYQIDIISKSMQKTPAVLVIQHQKDYLYGTILTPHGDYRYLHGYVKNNELKLANFEGVFNFLIEGIIKENKIEAVMISQENSTIVGLKNNQAKVELKNPVINQSVDFSFSDTSNKLVKLSDKAFKNKPVIIQIFGSWCPNCIDETLFLLDWLKTNKKIPVVGLSFERGLTEKDSLMHLKKVIKKRSITYPMLIAGKTAEDTPEKILPWIKNFSSFPTTIFLNTKHEVVKVHSGFNGPGTGEYFEAYKKNFEKLTKILLKN